MRRKVIYVSFVHLSDKTARDWYLDTLVEQGVPVEFWDVAGLIFGDDGRHSKPSDVLRVPTSYHQIDILLRLTENEGACYIMLATYETRTVSLYRLMSKHNCRMFYIAWGAMPIGQAKKWRARLLQPRRSAANLVRKLRPEFYRRLRLIRPFEIVFAAGDTVVASTWYAGKVVQINLVDYDHYVRAKSTTGRLVDDRYVVFLDVNLPHQPDVAIAGLRAVNAHTYFASLNRFFGLLEARHGVRVVVAAHPTASYDTATFAGRAIYQGVTPELVRDAEFVISHHSTSLSYVVLNAKPVMFVYTDEMLALYEPTVISYLRELASYLDASILNVDKISRGEDAAIKPVNTERYAAFKYNFLTTHESENTTTQKIFLRELQAHLVSECA